MVQNNEIKNQTMSFDLVISNASPKDKDVYFVCFCLFCCFTLEQALNQYFVHILVL